MNILERTKLLDRVAECNKRSDDAVKLVDGVMKLVNELLSRIEALESARPTLSLKGKEALQNADGQRRPTS